MSIRPLVLDSSFYQDPKIWQVDANAGFMLVNIAIWSGARDTAGVIPRSTFRYFSATLSLNEEEAIQRLLKAGLIHPAEGDDESYVIADFQRWTQPVRSSSAPPSSGGMPPPSPPPPPPDRETSPEVSKVRSAAAHKSWENRRSKESPVPLEAGSDGFDREAGYLEAMAAYPPGFREKVANTKGAYAATVDTAEDHANVMRGILNYAAYQRWITQLKGPEEASQFRIAFQNFVGKDEFQNWQASKVPTQQKHGLSIEWAEDEVKELEE